MAKSVEELAKEIHVLPDKEKLRLVDAILADLDKPDPEIDRIWAEEARRRWAAYKSGRARTVLIQPSWPSIAPHESPLSCSCPAGDR